MPVDIVTGHIKYKDSNGQYQEIAGFKGESGGVSDVQVNGVSVVTDGVANIPKASSSTLGALKVNESKGTNVESDGTIYVRNALHSEIITGSNRYRPITPDTAHYSAFYGLAKASGCDTRLWPENDFGTYTETAKSKISDMLNAPVTVSSTTPSITAQPGVRYICGEVSTLDIVVPASGIIDVVFESGSTATVLTVTPPTGITMKWANGFDPTSLDVNTVYEINIMDGCYGVAGSWT